MIIENQDECIDKAHEISKELMDVLQKSFLTKESHDNPREIVYIVLHTGGLFLARLTSILEGYCHMFEGDQVTTESLRNAMLAVYNDYLKLRDEYKTLETAKVGESGLN